MNRASLVLILFLSAVALSSPARAADPPGPADQADPFAGPPEPPTVETDEDALLRGPVKPSPPPQRLPPAARPVPRAPRRVAQVSEEGHTPPAPVPAEEQSGVALELSTSGFASGSLGGGVFIGGRTSSGLILGGLFDYALQSTTVSGGGTDVTASTQLFRLGAGVRHAFVRSADRLVDLYGAADASFEYHSAEAPVTGGAPAAATVTAAGFSLALGPGLRLWVHNQIAIGYAARLRLTYLSGDSGAIAATASSAQSSASATTIGFDGTFQILGVF